MSLCPLAIFLALKACLVTPLLKNVDNVSESADSLQSLSKFGLLPRSPQPQPYPSLSSLPSKWFHVTPSTGKRANLPPFQASIPGSLWAGRLLKLFEKLHHTHTHTVSQNTLPRTSITCSLGWVVQPDLTFHFYRNLVIFLTGFQFFLKSCASPINCSV